LSLPLSPKDRLPGDQVVHCVMGVIETRGRLAIDDRARPQVSRVERGCHFDAFA
jgi:hypothetical protein